MTNRLDALILVGDAVVETVQEAGPLGAPAGPMYAAFMALGVDLQQFEALMAGLVQAGRLRKSGDLYYAIPDLTSDGPQSDSSATPAESGAKAGGTTMAITDRNLAPGTKLVGKYKGKEYRAEVVATEAGPRYRMTLGKETTDYKSPSAAGAAIFGIDSNGKPRTCNGWGFFSIDGEAPAPAATTAPKGRTRRQKATEAATEPTPDPEPAPVALPIVQRLDDTFECQATSECQFADADRQVVADHVMAEHPQEVAAA